MNTYIFLKKIVTTTKAPTSGVDPNTICINGNGFYEDPTSNCRNFFLCVFTGTPSAKVYTYTCPDDLLFDTVTKACNTDVICRNNFDKLRIKNHIDLYYI